MSQFKNIEKLEFENLETSSPKQSEKGQEDAINLSVKVAEALTDKMKNHNKKTPNNKVSLSQLKKVFKHGASKISPDSEEKNPNHWGMARVNMFLRMLQGDKMTRARKYVSNSNVIDISEMWFPSKEDLDQARKDIENNKLNYIFGDVRELYLDDYERPDHIWV
tara:strand:+ start:2655 stop:3146 length:492 start_codon:yes stop_codon:yes gene_type:complete